MRRRRVLGMQRGLLGGLTAALAVLLTIDTAEAITLTRVTLSSGVVAVAGRLAAGSAPITWNGGVAAVASQGGQFSFTTTNLPGSCVGTLSDGVSTVQVSIPGCQPTLPVTGQVACWNSVGTGIPCAGTGQDGDVQAGAPLSYTDNGDGTITDHNTGLMWAKKSDDGSIHDKDNVYTWGDAAAVHIAGLNGAAFAGYTDWRLPSMKELQSILNYGNQDPAVAAAFHTGCGTNVLVTAGSCTAFGLPVAPDGYWSDTPYKAQDFGIGIVSGAPIPPAVERSNPVRAVRGPEAAPPSSTDNLDGTITDHNTGLMWAKKTNDESIHDQDTLYSWDNATAVHIAGLNGAAFAGYTDWRLPNIKELYSIQGLAAFPETGEYWSSSSQQDSPTSGRGVGFGVGAIFDFALSKTTCGGAGGCHVRAVRGGRLNN